MSRYWILLILLMLTNSVNAGSNRAATNPNITPQQLVEFAKKVERAAAQHRARVFILARTGRPLADMPRGMEYTHTAIAIYSHISTTDGDVVPGYVIYNLYQDDEDVSRSNLVTDFPADFFAAAHQLKAGIAIPNDTIQQRLINLITSGEYKALHNPNYSLVANPFNSEFQNCTEYTLDLINAAIYNNQNIAQLKANSKAYFKPQPVHMSGLKLSMAALLMDDLSLKDHQNKVQTATFTTITRYLEDYGLLQHKLTLEADENQI